MQEAQSNTHRGAPIDVSVSIIICTCNRVQSLRQTLEGLGKLRIPSGWEAEVIVVDNGSTDDTAAVVRNVSLTNVRLKYVHEPKRGQSHARNTGLANARGDFILYTDDDVLVAEDWMAQMVSPLKTGSCDAVTGRISAPPHLMRPWMRSMHKISLALNYDAEQRNGTIELFGASSGFRRSVLERVPAFDPELGPGALGFMDETLFAWQLREAGFKIGYAPEAQVFHHFDATRLRRESFLNSARKHGKSVAYVRYHWQHEDIRNPRLRWLSYWVRLRLRAVWQRPPPLEAEGCSPWEMSYVEQMEMCRQFCLEAGRQRKYARRGLKKCG